MLNRKFFTIAIYLLMSFGPTFGAEVPSSGKYVLYGKSMFDFAEGTNAYLSGGVPLNYTVDVTMDDKGNVTFDGLMGPHKQYLSITGKYNADTRSVKFITPAETVTSTDPYISLGIVEDNETMLCSFNPYGYGYLKTLEQLSFTFSNNGNTIYPSSGFGVGVSSVISKDLYKIDYIEAIYDAILVKKGKGVCFALDNRKVNIDNSYPNIAGSSTF